MKRMIPWLSLSWGIISVFLISHNSAGLSKLVFFSALLAVASLAGFFVSAGRSSFLDWLRLVSQQSALQYILFFALPLLWKAQNWLWLILVGLTGMSTLWDPLFNSLWSKQAYRMWVVVVCLTLLWGLTLVINAPMFFYLSPLFLIGICFASHFIITFNQHISKKSHSNDSSKSSSFGFMFFRQSWRPSILAIIFFMTATPLPPLGVWLNSGEIRIDQLQQSIECETRIAAPDGCRSRVTHVWEFGALQGRSEEIPLPEIAGNGIDQKPFRTISRKKAFSIPFNEILKDEIHCSVFIPDIGPVGRVAYKPPN